MNNKEYITELSKRTNYTAEYTQKLVRTVVEAMAQQFDEGEDVSIPAFGTFELKNRKERVVVNPQTNKRMMVPPKIVLNFKPATSTKGIINPIATKDE